MDALAKPLCPCCLRPLAEKLTARDFRFLELPGNASVAGPLLELLAAAWPRSISKQALIDHVYGDRPDGGPDTASDCIRMTIWNLRRRLAPFGWTISDSRKGGGYRLERVG
jgi:DNA-binding winged helix-turn-helix (wHTH) protein